MKMDKKYNLKLSVNIERVPESEKRNKKFITYLITLKVENGNIKKFPITRGTHIKVASTDYEGGVAYTIGKKINETIQDIYYEMLHPSEDRDKL